MINVESLKPTDTLIYLGTPLKGFIDLTPGQEYKITRLVKEWIPSVKEGYIFLCHFSVRDDNGNSHYSDQAGKEFWKVKEG